MKRLILLLAIFLLVGYAYGQAGTIPTITGSNSGDGEIKAIVAAAQANDNTAVTRADTDSARIDVVETDIDSLKGGEAITLDEVITDQFVFYNPTTGVTTYGDTSGFGGTGYSYDTTYNDARVTINATQLQDSLGWFNVMSYGAIDDGGTDNTSAFQDAVDACGDDGGGIVYVPEGDFNLDGTVTIDNDYVHIKGTGHGSKITFTNTGKRIGFNFSKSGTDLLNNCSIKNLYIWLEEDTITAVKLTRSIFSNVNNLRIRNFTGGDKRDTAIMVVGTDNWAGGNDISRNYIHDVHVALHMDSISNHNSIISNWFIGNTNKYTGSIGANLLNAGAESSVTNTFYSNDFEGFEKAVYSEQVDGKFTDNRFENNDTAFYINKINGNNNLKGNTYSTTSVEYIGEKYYNIRMDGSRLWELGKGIGDHQPGINFYGTASTDGPEIEMFTNYVSTTYSLFHTQIFGYASHTNHFGETVSESEANISGNYLLKIGTVLNGSELSFYTESNKRLEIDDNGIAEYADNAAAKAGGLIAPQMYRKSDGTLMIVYD